uniref:Integrase catalytic domain-containing protein n=1 Tax=Amphimedon queenslandica TaxID=400682 RepID=A0A1X7VKM2_AMPQE
MFLIIVDAYSKWLEVCIVPSTSSEATIIALRPIFATHGIPDKLVLDNGTGFTGTEFNSFLKDLGCHHICTAPYHPSSIGLAERAFRPSNLTSTGLSPPAELLMGRKVRNKLDLLHPDISHCLTQQQQNWSNSGQASACRKFKNGDTLFARNYRGPVSYIVKTTDGIEFRRHVDQLRYRSPHCEPPEPDDADLNDDWVSYLLSPIIVDDQPRPPPPPPNLPQPLPAARRSTRPRQPVDQHGPYLSSLEGRNVVELLFLII